MWQKALLLATYIALGYFLKVHVPQYPNLQDVNSNDISSLGLL
jgi:hypothetical protein